MRKLRSYCAKTYHGPARVIKPSDQGGDHDKQRLFRVCGTKTEGKDTCPHPSCKAAIDMVEYLVLASVAPKLGVNGNGLNIERTYGSIFVPAKPPDEPFASVVIEDAIDWKVVRADSWTEPDHTPVTISCRDIVRDIMQNEELEKQGVIVCAGNAPTKEELAKARVARQDWLVQCVQEGDDAFAKQKLGVNIPIPDYARRAVVELGETREWAYTPGTEKVQCAGCGKRVAKLDDGRDPAMCMHCGAPINRALYDQLYGPPKEVKRKKEAVAAE